MSAAGAQGPRADAQRRRILAAAHKCFAERGFHAASMASIAETAAMSPGLIYRYFSGKGDIIRGIVQQQLELMAADLESRRSQPTDLADLLVESYDHPCQSEREGLGLDPGLVLEISAEASRDPMIAEAMQALDQTLQTRIEHWLAMPLAQGGAGLPQSQVTARALMLRMIIDGMKMRQARDPHLDRTLLRQALDTALDGVVAGGRDGDQRRIMGPPA